MKEKLVKGIISYAENYRFTKAVIGLSGGIDSAVTASLAVEALGAGNVLGIAMPSRISSPESLDYAKKLAKNLNIRLDVYSIKEIFDAYKKTLSSTEHGLAEENLQARIRANILMALSNKHGYLVLATGNKSESLTGYGTLYGDLAGGLAPLANVYKGDVYLLANELGNIPQEIIKREPSAELRPGQKDTDALPPYDILDKILRLLFDENKTVEEAVEAGFERGLLISISEKIKSSRFKRDQCPPGIKI